MAVTTTLKIKPELDGKSLTNLENNLNRRFSRVAKRFGKGLSSSLKKFALGGGAFAVLNKLLNPLKEVSDAITKTLETVGATVSQSEAFGTTAGRLMKLQTFARAKGLSDEELYSLLGRYQSAIVKARQDPNEPSAVRNFTGYDDMAEGFFAFIQSMRKNLNRTQQIEVQEKVFGSKQTLKAGEFLNTDFEEFSKLFKRIDPARITKRFESTNKLSDEANVRGAIRETLDTETKAGLITRKTIIDMDRQKQREDQMLNEQIKSFENLQKLQETADQMKSIMDKAMVMVGELIGVLTPFIKTATGFINSALTSNWFKGIFKFVKGN